MMQGQAFQVMLGDVPQERCLRHIIMIPVDDDARICHLLATLAEPEAARANRAAPEAPTAARPGQFKEGWKLEPIGLLVGWEEGPISTCCCSGGPISVLGGPFLSST